MKTKKRSPSGPKAAVEDFVHDAREVSRRRIDEPEAVLAPTLLAAIRGGDEELVRVVVTVDGADAGVLLHPGGVPEEDVAEGLAVLLEKKDAADATEERSGGAVRLAVETRAGAVAGVVDHVVVKVPDLDADGQAVVRGVREVGVLGGDDEGVPLARDSRAVLGAGIEDDGLVPVAALESLLVEEEDPAAGVAEDGDPLVGGVEVDGALLDDVEEARERSLDQILVVAVRNGVDPAVEDVDAVVGVPGTAGEDECVAPAQGAVDAGAGSGDLEGAPHDGVRPEIDDGGVGRVGVGDDDAADLAGGHHVGLVPMVMVVPGGIAGRGGCLRGSRSFGGRLSGRGWRGIVAAGSDEECGGHHGRQGTKILHGGTPPCSDRNRCRPGDCY